MQDKITVLVTVRADDRLLQQLQEVSPRLRVVYHPAHTAADIPPDVWGEAEVLFTGDLVPDREMAPNLRWVQVTSAGVDRLIEHPLFDTHDVLLSTASGIHAVTMAEHALALMLACARHIPALLRHQAAHEWPREAHRLLEPRLLRGATLGIVGYGSIGRELGRLGRALGMQILATKREAMRPGERVEYTLPGIGDPDGTLSHRLYPPQALKSMLKDCDYVVVLTPRTPETENIFDAEAIAAMKPGAVLINLARGGIVDEAALLQALQSGALAGAGFDVFATEPLPEDSPLWAAPNLIISPHIAGAMPDYLDRAVDVFVENLRRYVAGREMVNVVDWERRY